MTSEHSDRVKEARRKTRPGFVPIERGAVDRLAQRHGLTFYARAVLLELALEAGWEGENRGAVSGFTVAAWAEHLGIGRNRLSEALVELEAAGAVEHRPVRGHEGTVRILAYDEIAPDLARINPRERTPAVRVNRRERPGKRATTTRARNNPPTPVAEESPQSAALDDSWGEPLIDENNAESLVDELQLELGQFTPTEKRKVTAVVRDRLDEGITPATIRAVATVERPPRVFAPGAFAAGRLRDLDRWQQRVLNLPDLRAVDDLPPAPERPQCDACGGCGRTLDELGDAHRCAHCNTLAAVGS